MSVFQLLEWWQVQASQDEEYDAGCLAVGNVDNAQPPSEKIVLGSLQGVLRIYAPVKPVYRVEDLLLEEQLGEPILQVLLGQFIPGDQRVGVAVLHPKRLRVFEVVPQGNREGRGGISYYSLRKCYEHDLGIEGKHFTAYNMISGSFGGVKGRDMIMVQSMDGKLQIFEQSAMAFTRQLVDCLIPHPLAYIPKLDAFVTTSYTTVADCYRYQVMASTQTDIGTEVNTNNNNNNNNNGSSGGNSNSNSRNSSANNGSQSKGGKGSAGGPATTGAFGLTALRSALVEWSVPLGETCRQILIGNFVSAAAMSGGAGLGHASEVLVLCDRSLFLLKASGGIIQQRRLEHEAVCMCLYNPTGGNKSNFLLADSTGTIHVYNDFNLAWAAKATTPPVQMAVASFGNQKGMIVTVNDTGHLVVGYLGTKPPITSVVNNSRELDYDKIDEEHRLLLNVIREAQSENKTEPREKLLLKTQMLRVLDVDPANDLINSADVQLVPLSLTGLVGDTRLVKICVRLYVSYSGSSAVSNVNISVSTPGHIHAAPKSLVLNSVSGSQSTPLQLKIFLYATKNQLPLGGDVQIVASYISATGEPNTTSTTIAIPLHLTCRPRPAVKTALYKFTLDTTAMTSFSGSTASSSPFAGGPISLPPIPLTELFDDFLFAYSDCGVDVTDAVGGSNGTSLGWQFWSSGFIVDEANRNGAGGGGGAELGTSPVATGGRSGTPSSYSTPAVVSVLLSKAAGRYRIQSDTLSALPYLLKELERRLVQRATQHLQEQGALSSSSFDRSDIFAVKCDDALPVNELFAAIDAHYSLRVEFHQTQEELNKLAHQYRMIEKRLLVRYKDRNPTPLNGLDTLLNETYRQLIRLSDKSQTCQVKLGRAAHELHCLLSLTVSVTGMKIGLSISERELLSQYFCIGFVDSPDQGWEETVDLSLTYLLKTHLAKTAKDTTNLSSTSLEFPGEVDSLKKHISMVLDRLAKGARLSTNPAAPPSNIASASSSLGNTTSTAGGVSGKASNKR